MSQQVLTAAKFITFLRNHKEEIRELYTTKYEEKGMWYGMLNAALEVLQKDKTFETDQVTVFTLGDLLRETPHYTNPSIR